MSRRFAAVLFLAAALGAGAAQAAEAPTKDPGDLMRVCEDPSEAIGMEASITHCTDLLSLPGASVETRVNALLLRAHHLARGGEAPSALPDYAKALTIATDNRLKARVYAARGQTRIFIGQRATGDADVAAAKKLDPGVEITTRPPAWAPPAPPVVVARSATEAQRLLLADLGTLREFSGWKFSADGCRLDYLYKYEGDPPERRLTTFGKDADVLPDMFPYYAERQKQVRGAAEVLSRACASGQRPGAPA